jgi:tetratricopeptide (TPR) repeat protein
VDQSKLAPDDIFCAAIELAEPAERAVYLDQVCGDDLDIRRRVERLLEAHSHAGSFLAARPALVAATTDWPAESSGTTIGPYKLLQMIGEGGMGAVWMAEQTQPVRRKVALKIIKAGMDSRQVLARFEAERQALALMDHPNIARVLDGGATAAGRPFFVMELIKGQPITEYCDERRLTPRQRLELFVDVCQAIQHAHQKGIVHRDVKPSNVLVAPYDGRPVVKVIDFGVAKATGQRLTEKTLFTELGAVVGTFEYMSPEQAELNNQDIDTRSDIYGLGVLLYELLTGSTPLTRQQLKQVPFNEMLRMIREQEPPKPSTRLSRSEETLPSISAQRQVEPAKLTKLVRGELDWIVMKALEKDRNRRYETANGFARDVQRYLADEPVQACPPSASYRIRKFTRRHRVAIWTTGVVATSLVLGTVVSVCQAVRATHAETLADIRLQAETRARQDADASLQMARKATHDYFNAVCGIDILCRQGKYPEAEKAIREVLAAQEKLAGDSSNVPEFRDILFRTHWKLGDMLRTTNRVSEADKEYRQAINGWVKLAKDIPTEPTYRRDAAVGLGYTLVDLLWSNGQYQEALEALHQSVSIFEKLVEEFPGVNEEWRLKECRSKLYTWMETRQLYSEAVGEVTKEIELKPKQATLLIKRAGYYARLKQWDKALADYTKAIDLEPRNVGVWISRADSYAQLNQWDKAIADYSKAIELDPKSVPALRGRAIASERLGQLDKSLADYSTIIDLEPRNVGAWMSRAEFYFSKLKQWDKAIADYSKAIELDPKSAGPWQRRGDGYAALRQWDKAIADYTKVIELTPHNAQAWHKRAHGHEHLQEWEQALADFGKAIELSPKQASHWHCRGRCYLNSAQWDRAIADFTKAIELDPKNADSHNQLAWLLATAADVKTPDPDRALALAKKAVELAPKVGSYWNTLGVAHYRTGDWKAALAVLEKSLQLQGDNGWDWFCIAMCQQKLGDMDKARGWYDQATRWMDKNQPKNEELGRFRAEASQVLGLDKKKD